MHPDDRWRLYFYYLQQYKVQIMEEIIGLEKNYQTCYKAYEEIREMEDLNIMRGKLVIGMTTTGAARLQGSLRALKSPIVIVEEAAEIMESHVITALTEYCQHLILIGDHQQLRPNTADYTMETKYFLGISLFERMIRNKIHCNTLEVQHRMRPELAKLIAPNIYPHLKNHESVNNFPPIRGIDNCLYFITHTQPEELCADSSKSNIHEAKFLLQLAKYLILNGYQSEDITILAAYSGQMFAMRRERQKIALLKHIRITVLDNYQGEESKIILLSLVRNNAEKAIGFLKIENRVCVALSRAREGLYIMGNIDLLCSNSSIWPKIRGVLEEQNSLGTSLPLRCQIHSHKLTQVARDNDFFKVSEGGCDLICEELLTCGHNCMMQCHILNRDHNLYKCKQPCTRILCENSHVCPKFCFEDCDECQVPMLRRLKCGHEAKFPCYQTEFICKHPVRVELPCKHIVDNKPCYIEVEKYRCPYPCDARLDTCGHSCVNRCHINNDPDHLEYKCYKPCSKFRKRCSEKHICQKLCYQACTDCDIVIKKTRSCTHVFNIACSDNVEEIECDRRCKKTLPCTHPCKLPCNVACGICNQKVNKIVPSCRHKILIECSTEPTRFHCDKKCPLTLPCGHQCSKKCKEDCTSQCTVLVDSKVPLPCGHQTQIPCYMNTADFIKTCEPMTVLKYCRARCSTKLECGHTCVGSCGECYQGRIHKICGEACGVPLVCGHECKVPCRQACQPCSQPCMYRCKHSKCTKRCGDICTPCKQSCSRQCEHVRCDAWCSEKCTVSACTEPCKEILRCGHQCIGFCGEPCPPLCIVCNKEELLAFYTGFEDEEDARFVLLQECGHIIESRGMEMWLESDNDQIKVKRCPQCRTPLSSTKRYNNYILESIEEIQAVKLKFYGDEVENDQLRDSLRERIAYINSNNSLKQVSKAYNKAFSTIDIQLRPVYKGRKQFISKISGQILASKIQILEDVCKLYNTSTLKKTLKSKTYVDFLLDRLIQEENRMTDQEINDYMTEIKRLQRILQFSDIEATYPHVVSQSLYTPLNKILYSYRKYDVTNDNQVKRDLEILNKNMGGSLIVSDKELQDIIKVINVKQGAWFKCPNGHLYAIGDCGGAMIVSKCADCGVPIGGQHHTILASNQHANVDRSIHPAWSEQANMANYQF